MKEPVRIEVRNGSVSGVHGPCQVFVYDWDSFQLGDPFICPVCDKEFGADRMEDARSIIERGHCLTCSPQWAEEVFYLTVFGPDIFPSGSWTKVFRTQEAAMQYLTEYVAGNWEAVTGEECPKEIGRDEIDKFIGMAGESFSIGKETIIE